MFVLHWSSPCWSKLNAEVSLFYFPPFHDPSFFFLSFFFLVEKQTSEQFPHSSWSVSHLLVVQFSLIGVTCLVSPTSSDASQYD